MLPTPPASEHSSLSTAETSIKPLNFSWPSGQIKGLQFPFLSILDVWRDMSIYLIFPRQPGKELNILMTLANIVYSFSIFLRGEYLVLLVSPFIAII